MSVLAGTWRRVFLRRHAAYRALFGTAGTRSPSARRVLADLRRFCHATDSCFVAGDPHASARNEGRREVYTRILSYAEARPEEVFRFIERMEDRDDE